MPIKRLRLAGDVVAKLADALLEWMGRYYLGPVWVVLLLGLTGTAALSWSSWRFARQAATEQFNVQAVHTRAALNRSMQEYINLLKLAAGFAETQAVVDRMNWKTFISRLDIAQSLPGVQGIGYAAVVPPDQLEAHVARQRAGGRPDYTMRPQGLRDVYTAIVGLEPEDERNLVAIGFDMFSEPIRRAAMTRARDTGEAALTTHVKLVQETGQNPQPGALLYMPVYASTADGRPVLRGYAYAAFRLHDLLSRTLRASKPEIFDLVRVQVFENSEESFLLFDSSPPSHPDFVTEQVLEIGGQKWTLAISSLEAFEQQHSHAEPLAIAVMGGLLTVLIAAFMGLLTVSRASALSSRLSLEHEVHERVRAQEQEQIANRELIHRVKNMMAIIASIASQTARYTPDPQKFNQAFRQRLSALGRVHDLLKPNPSIPADLGGLLEEVLAPYRETRAGRLSLSGPKINIPQGDAVMLSLVFNELGTNATKYGAWANDNGRVDVKWELNSLDTGSEVRVAWRENDGPTVTYTGNQGFGSNVMKFAIERGLRGRFQIIYGSDGLACDLNFPLKTEIPSPAKTY